MWKNPRKNIFDYVQPFYSTTLMAQKNFTINAATKAAFAAFCKENAYTGNAMSIDDEADVGKNRGRKRDAG